MAATLRTLVPGLTNADSTDALHTGAGSGDFRPPERVTPGPYCVHGPCVDARSQRQEKLVKLEAAARQAAIVVGADGSERNLAAINWAADLAVRANRNLRIVVVGAPPAASQLSLREPIQYPVAITEAYAERVVSGWALMRPRSIS